MVVFNMDEITLTSDQLLVMRLLMQGKRIYQEREFWRLVEPEMINNRLSTNVSIVARSDDVYDMIKKGLVMSYESKASEYHGFMVLGKKPKKEYFDYDRFRNYSPNYRQLYWTDCNVLILTEYGRKYWDMNEKTQRLSLRFYFAIILFLAGKCMFYRD